MNTNWGRPLPKTLFKMIICEPKSAPFCDMPRGVHTKLQASGNIPMCFEAVCFWSRKSQNTEHSSHKTIGFSYVLEENLRLT